MGMDHMLLLFTGDSKLFVWQPTTGFKSHFLRKNNGLLFTRTHRNRCRQGVQVMACNQKQWKVLLIGGTRFSGLYIARELALSGHQVVLFNRGSVPIGDISLKIRGETEKDFQTRMSNTHLIKGDRTHPQDILRVVQSEKWDAIFDNNGRELSDSKPWIDGLGHSIQHYMYMSSAGVYKESGLLPHREEDAVDHNSRHKGKLETEQYLKQSGIPFTCIRPTYIYGPRNYNPVEEWFFKRIDQNRPIPIPGHGLHITGLGHVEDLAKGRYSVTFDGFAKLCAIAAGKDPNKLELIHYDPKKVPKDKKSFPFRPQHFFCSCAKAERELQWKERWDLVSGLKDSYENDFIEKKKRNAISFDFSLDDQILESLKEAKSMLERKPHKTKVEGEEHRPFSDYYHRRLFSLFMALAKQLENIKARGDCIYRRTKAPPSILFDDKVSRKLDTEQILNLAVEGLETLRNLDQRFCRFEHSIFSLLHPIDRNLKDDEENRGIDKEIREFCLLASPYFLLRATHKCLEWLIRGLEAGKRNVDDLIALALPFHATPPFSRVLSACELEPTRWTFLKPVCQHKESLQRNTLRQQAPLWLWRFVTQTAKDCAQRSVRASQLFSFWAVFVREKLQTIGEKDNIIMKDVLLDTLLGIQMRQGDWDSLLEYRNASVVVLCTFFERFKLNSDILSACMNALCCSFESVCSLQNMTQAVYPLEKGSMFYQLLKSLVKCLMLLFFYHCDVKKEMKDAILTSENISQLCKNENTLVRILKELASELDIDYSKPFMIALCHSMIEQLTTHIDYLEALCQIFTLMPVQEFLGHLIKKLLEFYERHLEMLSSKPQNTNNIALSSTESQSIILQRLQKVMSRLKTMANTQELDLGIREYLKQSKNASIREQLVGVLFGIFSGSMLLPVIIHREEMDSTVFDQGNETIAETLLGVLEHPEAAIREYALKMLKQHLLVPLESSREEDHSTEEIFRNISETLIRHIDMEDCLSVVKSVLELFIEHVKLQNSVRTLLFWSIERRLERIWKQVDNMDKQITLALLQKLPLLQVDESTCITPSLLGTLLSFVFHPDMDSDVKQAAFHCWMTLWRRATSRKEVNHSVENTTSNETDISVSIMIAVLTNWMTKEGCRTNESTYIISIVEKLMKDCLDNLSYEKKQPWQMQMTFHQLLFISVVLNMFLRTTCDDEKHNNSLKEKIYWLMTCFVECIALWILSDGRLSKNKPLDSEWKSAWTEHANWMDPLFLRRLFLETNGSLLFFGGMSVLKQFYQTMDDERTRITKRTQLLATILFPLENSKWKWSLFDREMIYDCICQLSKSALYFLVEKTKKKNDLRMSIFFVLYQYFPSARPAIESAWKCTSHEIDDRKKELVGKGMFLQDSKMQDPSVPLVHYRLSDDVKVAMLRSCFEMKYFSDFHIQLLILLAPIDEEQTISLELLETVVELLQRLEDNLKDWNEDELQNTYSLITRYFTFVDEKDQQVASENQRIWDVYFNHITSNTDSIRIAFLQRWPFVVSCGNQQRWKDLALVLFQLWMDTKQEDVVVLQVRQLIMKLAEVDISLFLIQLEDMVKGSQMATWEELPLVISRSIPLLEVFANVSIDVLNDEDDLSHLVKSLTIYLSILSKALENRGEEVQSSASSYAQGLIVSILYRLCKYFGKRFPIGSLNLKIFTQDEQQPWAGAFSRAALIRLICYLTSLFPSELKENFTNALKWMLRTTNTEYVISNISYITPAVIAILSQDDREDMITVPFITELLSFLDSESCLLLARNIFESLGQCKLETILFSYLLRDATLRRRQGGDRNIQTFWEPYKRLLFSFPLTIQIHVVEQFLQTMDTTFEEEIFHLSLEWVRCTTLSPMFRSWHVQDDHSVMRMDSEEYHLETSVVSLLERVFFFSVGSQDRMEMFQEQYSSSILCLFPFPLFIRAMKNVLSMESNEMAYLGLTCISQLLYTEEWKQTKHATWYGTMERIKHSICIQLLPEILEIVIKVQVKDSKLRMASIAALDICVHMYPRENLLEKLSPALQPLMSFCCEKRKTLASSSMLCLSTIIRRLRISCVEYVPQLLQVITTVWERCCKMANDKKQNIKQQNYIRAVIVLVSSFQDHLSHFWSVACVCSMLKCCSTSCKNTFGQQVMDQMQRIMSHLRVHVAVPVLNTGLEDISIHRIHFLLCCMEKWFDNVSNKELRSHQHEIFSCLLKALDIRRQSIEMGLLLDEEEVAELDNKIGNIFTKQALRLMESDFKVLFMRLVGWCEEEFSSPQLMIPYHWDDLCPFRCCYERLISFFKVVCSLAQGLRELFLPYFSYVLDWCLWVASYPSLEKYWKKMENHSTDWKFYKRKKEWQSADSNQIIGYRKSLERRGIMEAVNAIREYLMESPSHGDESLFDSIFHLLESRLDSNATMIDANVLASMISLFAEKIAKQLSVNDEKDSDNNVIVASERRLASLNRFLLIKCRDKDQVKQVSMVCVEQMIHRLGHRFLSLLPETLPLLAECLEDETLEEKTMQVVQYLEDLSGEPIRNYLVK
ncbi:Ubiquitin-conjugating enzyme E2 J2 [Galdieria sulphuraria]|nr:Ubiquitin-conjugating enzyme E2 J2 [Galdieria sulphuraria]